MEYNEQIFLKTNELHGVRKKKGLHGAITLNP